MKIAISILIMMFTFSVCGDSPALDRSVSIKKSDVVIPNKIETFLIKEFGLSSTGSIQVIGKYQLTQNCKLGAKQDDVIHVIHKDLFGSRLSWSCLINLTQEKVQLLYRSGNSDEYGTHMEINKKSPNQRVDPTRETPGD